MSSHNRDRRRAKKQRRHQEHRARANRGDRRVDGGAHSHDDRIRDAVLAAALAFRFDPPATYRAHLDALAAVATATGPAPIDRAVAWWLERGLDRAWESGWQPADVMRAVRRTLSLAHASALAQAIAESGARRPEAATDDRWAAQVGAIHDEPGRGPRSLFATDPAVAVEGVSVVLHLPPLPSLSGGSGGPARGRRPGSGPMLERVRALLAKAESTAFPEEADALTTKAQELMGRHAIDQAMVDAGSQGTSTSIAGWRLGVDDPYAAAKSLLLARIADANRCRAVWTKHLGFSTVFGDQSDLEMVEILFTSLLVQGTEAMLHAGRAIDRAGRPRTRSFRQSFLVAFASRIGERLHATMAQVVAEGAQRHGEALLPVLASRAEEVEEAVTAAYPHMVERGLAVSNYSGWAAGRAAAELASLAVGEELAAG
ncbi:MAG: DUF2786 domain-containing protein [Acidimicrobiales bacterium]